MIKNYCEKEALSFNLKIYLDPKVSKSNKSKMVYCTFFLDLITKMTEEDPLKRTNIDATFELFINDVYKLLLSFESEFRVLTDEIRLLKLDADNPWYLAVKEFYSKRLAELQKK